MFHSEKYGVINKSMLGEKEIVWASELSVHKNSELPRSLLKGTNNSPGHVHFKKGFLEDSLDCSLKFLTSKWFCLHPSRKTYYKVSHRTSMGSYSLITV